MMRPLTNLLVCFFLSFSFLWVNDVYAQAPSANSNQKTTRISVHDALKLVSKNFGTQFVYEKKQLDGKYTTFNMNDIKSKPLEEVLKGILYPVDFVFLYVRSNYYTIVSKDSVGDMLKTQTYVAPVAEVDNAAGNTNEGNTNNRQVSVSGKVIDAKTKAPLQGVSINVKGSAHSVTTDGSGNFHITLPVGGTLVVTNVGYQSREMVINNGGNLNIELDTDVKELDAVVVVGYGSMKKSDVTGAVASVSAAQLNTVPVANAIEALSGKAAGVQIGSITRPGQSPNITIRGNRSINASNSPLFVVDGIPRGSIEDIPVSEIQSIEVLKDAVSASIYGSRGANGVVLVTTKSGLKTKEKTEINLSSYYGVNSINLPHYMDGETFMQYRRDQSHLLAYGHQGWATGAPLTDQQVFAPQELAAVANHKFTDWKKLLFNKTSATQQHDLSFSTSGVNTQTRFSVGFLNDEGYYPGNDAKRLTFGLKVDQKVLPFLRFSLSSRYTNTVANDVDPGVMMGAGDNTYLAMNYLNALIPAYAEDGSLIENVVDVYANPLLDYTNPFVNKTTKHKLFNVLSVNADILKGLKFTSNFGYDIGNRFEDEFYGKLTTKRFLFRNSEGAYARKYNRYETDLTWDNILNYTRVFGKHDINATAVTSLQKNERKDFSSSGTGLPDDVIGNWNMNLLQSNIQIGSSYRKQTLASAIGRFQYGYAGRYLFNVSVRTDGASVLAEGNKWATFPAASAAWIISKEAFYNSITLTHLKLRLSYGSVGNAAINPYETYAGVNSVRTNFENEMVMGYSLSGVVNKNLGWEISKTTNLGLDWALFNGRISGTIDAYRTYTTDLLFKRSLPHLSGSTEIWDNVGETSNMGLEVGVNASTVRTRSFTWNTDLTFSTNRSRIEKLITRQDMIDKNLFIGQPWRIYYSNVLDGIWQVDEAQQAAGFGNFPGYTKYKDLSGPEGKPDGKIDNVHDRVIRGQQDPKWTVFLRNSFSYKNFTVAFALNGNFGHMIQMSGSGLGDNKNPLETLSDYWTPDNPTGKYPLLSINLPSVWHQRKGDYLNVQEISMRYNFRFLGLKDVGISMQSRNPFFLYKAAKDVVDPSAPNSMFSAWKTNVIKLDIKL